MKGLKERRKDGALMKRSLIGMLFGAFLMAQVAQGATGGWEAPKGPQTAAPAVGKVLPVAALGQIITDPLGDDVTSPENPIVDIASVDGGSDGMSVTIKVDFSPDTVMSQVVGIIDLDTDQNAATGIPANANGFLGATQDLGVDYMLSLFALPGGGPVDVMNATTGETMGTVPAVFNGQSLSITVPLAMLGNDDGNMNVGMILGNFPQPTDAAPNAGHGTITAGPVSIGPACKIQLNKTTFVNNDVLTATALVTNSGTESRPVEFKVWAILPQTSPPSPPVSLMNVGADGSIVLTPGFGQVVPVLQLTVNAGLPRGTYELGCRILGPVTGFSVAEDHQTLVIQ